MGGLPYPMPPSRQVVDRINALTHHLPPFVRVFLLALVVVLGPVWPAWGEDGVLREWRRPAKPFLSREQREGFLNYGDKNYISYKRELDADKRFDPLGNFLLEGFRLLGYNEARPGRPFVVDVQRKDLSEIGSVQLKDTLWLSSFLELAIFQDSIAGWEARFTVGDDIRTRFTPLTLNLVRMTGMRFDVASPRHHKFTLVQWRGTNEFKFGIDQVFSIPFELKTDPAAGDPVTGRKRFERFPVQNFGGRWESKLFGGAVRLGSTFVNQHAEDVTKSARLNPLRGTISSTQQPPEKLVVVFSDDSPEDGRGGALVGDSSVLLTVMFGRSGGSDTTVVFTVGNGGEVRSPGVEIGPGFRQANGPDVIEYTFTIPTAVELGTPKRAVVEAVVANDYRIEIRQMHPFFDRSQGDRGEFVDRETQNIIYDRAPGNVADGSNKRRIRIDYGFLTGQSLLSFDWSLNLLGVKIEGEVSNNWVFSQFPTTPGRQVKASHETGWFVNVLKQIGPFTTGFEYFHIAPNYTSYNSRRGGVTLQTDQGGFLPDPDVRTASLAVEFPLVDDNDDGDQWPDDARIEEPIFRQLQFRPDAGVFPGVDEDQDGVPDDDRDFDGIPDWEEPFLLYYSDPLPFIYGDDFNNNGVIDDRENDEKADFPYDKDLEGPHWFVSAVPFRDVGMTAGLMDLEEPGRGGKTQMRYFKLTYDADIRSFGTLEFRHDTKRVRDDIPNHVYDPVQRSTRDRPVPSDLGPQPGDRLFDQLTRQNSLVHSSWLSVCNEPLRGFHITNNFKTILNRQFRGPLRTPFLSESEQADAWLNEYTLSNKADYRWRLGMLDITPQFKVLTRIITRNPKAGQGGDRGFERLLHEVRTAPIIRADLRVTKRTTLRFAQQGWRMQSDNRTFRNLFAAKIKDKTRGLESRSTTDFLVMFSNGSNYWGYPVYANIGLLSHTLEFDDPDEAAVRNKRFRRLFVEVVTGY